MLEHSFVFLRREETRKKSHNARCPHPEMDFSSCSTLSNLFLSQSIALFYFLLFLLPQERHIVELDNRVKQLEYQLERYRAREKRIEEREHQLAVLSRSKLLDTTK